MSFFPDNIKTVAIVATSGIPDAGKVKAGISFLEKAGISVITTKSVTCRCGSSYLASDVKTRVEDIHSCWKDNSIDAIVAVRGGYGSAHLLPFLDWDLISSRDIPFLGYSDLTAIHLAMYSRHAGTPVSAPMLNHFENINPDDFTGKYLRWALDDSDKKIEILPYFKRKNLLTIKHKTVEGRLIPVTLSVINTLIGTEFLPDMSGCILLIEDINEPVYKLDRYLTQLAQAGILRKLSGMLCGIFTRCGREADRLKLLNEFSDYIDGPVIVNIPFGHVMPRISVPFGINCSIDKNNRIFMIR